MVSQSDWLPIQITTGADDVLMTKTLTCDVTADRSSGDDIRQDTAADQSHFIFQPQFTLFQPLQLQLVKRGVAGKMGNNIIEVTMFAFQFAQTRVKLLLSPDIAVTHQSCSLSALRLRRLSALHQSP